jgi:hypothetical protein
VVVVGALRLLSGSLAIGDGFIMRAGICGALS